MTFSIIIPVYNVAPYLRECLDSVFAAARTLREKCEVRSEKCGGVEIICVDDGSTDGSGAILDEYAEKKVEKVVGCGQWNVSVKVIHQKNSGVSAARNTALDVATGEWVMFLDADDVWSPVILVTIEKEIMADEALDAVSFESRRFRVKPEFTNKITARHCSDLSVKLGPEDLSGHSLIMWSKCLRRDRCGKVRFERFVCGEDRLYTFDCLQFVSKILYLDAELYGYREREGSYTTYVIHTYNGLRGEVLYRQSFLRHVALSKKTCDFSGTVWLVEATIGFNESLLRAETLSYYEKSLLWKLWRSGLDEMLDSRVFTDVQKQMLNKLGRRRIWALQQAVYWARYRMFSQQSWIRRAYRCMMRHGEYKKEIAT